jgi:Flp pilus assembly protein TadB
MFNEKLLKGHLFCYERGRNVRYGLSDALAAIIVVAVLFIVVVVVVVVVIVVVAVVVVVVVAILNVILV